ncbi:MAG: YggT family protein [Alcanivoracaceae bacterium]|jgi:YggT family protein|nr:YggT family protein [Alcanivoracaceae bacterium]
MNPQGAFLFLLGFVIDLYIFLVLTRFLLQLVRADFYNPVSQFVVKATNPILTPLRKIIPGYGGMDVAALVAVVALIVFKLVLVSLLAMGALRFSPLQLLVVTVTELARLLLDYLFWTIILRIVLSWVAPDPRNPVVQLVGQITEPVMAPARKLLPPMGGLDLSPIIVLLAIQFIQILFGL